MTNDELRNSVDFIKYQMMGRSDFHNLSFDIRHYSFQTVLPDPTGWRSGRICLCTCGIDLDRPVTDWPPGYKQVVVL